MHFGLGVAFAPLSQIRTFGRGTAGYSTIGNARTPASSQRLRSVSQGSLTSATLNPIYSPRGSPESPQFQTPNKADLSLSPWPRARSEAGNVEIHSPLGTVNFSSPDRELPTQAHQPCPLTLALQACAARSEFSSSASNHCRSSSSDDGLPGVVHACTSIEILSRNGQPLLSGADEYCTRVW